MKRSAFCRMTALCAAVVLGGCAHSITISPDANKLARDDAKPRIDKQVGYHISDQNRALEVTTPAGGGDSVKYRPYADLEAGVNKMLANVFAAVHVVKNPQDQEFLKSKNISYVFTPTITTVSSSRNNFFWPPTDFSVTIDCVAADDQAAQIWKSTAQADGGVIPVKEILGDHGLAGKRAAENALKKLQAELETATVFRK